MFIVPLLPPPLPNSMRELVLPSVVFICSVEPLLRLSVPLPVWPTVMSLEKAVVPAGSVTV